MQSYVVHLIRHGITEANLNGKFAGSGDFPLCDEGKNKLKELMTNFKYPNSQEYYSSPMRRCVETCNIIYPDADLQIVDGFRECVFKNSADNVVRAESWEEIQKRVLSTFDDTVESMMRRGVTSATIFTHGGVIMTLLYCYGLPRAEFMDWMVNNGCGYSVRITPSIWMRDKIFEVYNRIPQGADVTLSKEIQDLINNVNSKESGEEKNE